MAKTKAAAAKPAKKGTSEFAGFQPEMIQFFGELALNNDREWFEANKQRYERVVREPALAFIRAMKPKLGKLSKHMLALDQKVGGSLMRPYRDTRFAADKTPYKTNLGVQFRHAAGKDVHAPGLYFHVDVDEVFLGAGTWHPEPDALASIRTRIAEQPKAWVKARDDAGFTKVWKLGGESLSRPPRGFDKEHAQIEDLKRKDHIAVCNFAHEDLYDPKIVDRVAERFAASKPYLKFLCAALDVPF
jgi:uncharacterized protein (TIGR02453 family)